MPFSFNPLWKLLIDKGMTKEKLRTALNLSPNTIAKMSKGEYVALEVIHRICEYFEVPIEAVIEYVPKDKGK